MSVRDGQRKEKERGGCSQGTVCGSVEGVEAGEEEMYTGIGREKRK